MKNGVIYLNKMQENDYTIFIGVCNFTQGLQREVRIRIDNKDKYNKYKDDIKKRIKGLIENWWMEKKAEGTGKEWWQMEKVNLELIEQ